MLFAMSHERPLLPIKPFTLRLLGHYPGSRFLQAVDEVFSVHTSQVVLRHPFQEDLPPNETVLGYATCAGLAEPGLSLPLGRRRVERVFYDDSREQLLHRGIHYVVLDDHDDYLSTRPLDAWLSSLKAELVKEVPYRTAPQSPANHLYLIRLLPAG